MRMPIQRSGGYAAHLLRGWMAARSWTVAELARNAGQPYTSVSEAVRGICIPGQDLCTALVEAVNAQGPGFAASYIDLRAACLADLVVIETEGCRLIVRRAAEMILADRDSERGDA